MKQNKKNPTKTSWYGMKMTKKKKCYKSTLKMWMVINGGGRKKKKKHKTQASAQTEVSMSC